MAYAGWDIVTKPKSLTNILWISMTSLYLVLVCTLTYLWISEKLKNVQTQIADVRESYIESRKEIIKTQVNQAVSYIQYKKSLAEKRVKQRVKVRTYEAYKIAHHIFDKQKADKSPDQIQQLIHDALYAASWDDGKGYYFAGVPKGNMVINRSRPELEGKSIAGLVDSTGKNLMDEFIAIIRSPEQEGFSYYYWKNPEHPGTDSPKISYIKYFEPLNWILGSGKYLVDEEEKIKKEVLDRIMQIKYGSDGYLFAGTLEGFSLSGPFTGKNMLHITDPNGVKIVEELIKAAESGGGFVEYVAPKYKGQPPKPKISYAQAIPEWNWYIGTGLHIDAIEAIITQKQEKMANTIKVLIMKGVAVLILFLFISFFIVWLVSGKIKKNLALFSEFFKRSAKDALPIEKEQISFEEFHSLAASANQMSKERKKSLKALRESEQRLFIHLQNTPVGAVSWDLNFRATEWNPAAEKIFGYPKEEAIGRHVTELILPEDVKEQGDNIFQDLLAERGGQQSENENITRDGQRILCDWYNTVLKDTDGNVIGVASLVNDITERKRTQEMMIQSEKMMSVGGLAAGMAHEINNPLAGMMQSAQVIRNRMTKEIPANEKTAQALGTSVGTIKKYMEKRDILNQLANIRNAGQRAARIISNMLSFSKKSDSERREVDLSRLIDDTLDLAVNDYNLKKKYDFRSVEILKEFEPGLPTILCEQSKIQQVIFNIIKNASESMHQDKKAGKTPRIIFRLSQLADMVCIEVEDNGPGIDADIRKRIFEPFFTTKSVDKGTGLGLSVSYFIIVDDHGGEMEVKSKPGKGTNFIVKLPFRV